MAKKSNKTAHVLNLLAGHDAAKDAAEEESAPAKEEASAAKSDAVSNSSGAVPSSGAAAGAVSPQPSAPSQNVSLIDTTGEDPVARVIHESLSNEFDRQLSGSPDGAPAAEANRTDTSAPTDSKAAPNPAEEPLPPVSEAEALVAKSADTMTAVRETALNDNTAAETAGNTAAARTVPGGNIISEASSDSKVTTETALNNEATAEITHGGGITADSVPDNKTAPETAPDSKAQAIPAPDSAPAAEVLPNSEAAEKSVPAPEPEPEPDFSAVNIMEHIVKDKIIYYMRQFEVCTCDRCVADTIAITLNGLTPKYIVTTPAAVDPLISYYTNRLISDVTVEATKACMIVKDNPRH